MYTLPYPINDITDNITYTTVYKEEMTVILSSYNSSNSLIDQDVLSLMNPFTICDWMLISSVMVTFLLVLITGRSFMEMKKRIKPIDTLWEVMTYWLDQDLPSAQYRYDQLISILMTIFLFFGMAWLTNNMSTDLMVATDVSTIQTYEEALDAGQPLMIKGTPEWSDFRDSDNGTIENRIFQRVLEQNESGSMYLKEITSEHGQNIMLTALSAYNERTLLWGRKFALLGRRLFCSTFLNGEMFPEFGDLKILIRVDPRAKFERMTFIMNKYSSSDHFIELYKNV